MAPRLMMKLDNENEDEDVIVDKLLRTVWSWTRAQLKRRGGGVDFEFDIFVCFCLVHCN